MTEFLRFFNNVAFSYPMHLDLFYGKTVDWCLKIYKKGCGKNEKDLVIVDEQDSDIELLCAKAQVKLKEHLLKVNGGY